MLDASISVKIHKRRSTHALVGAYLDIKEQTGKGNENTNSSVSIDGDCESEEIGDSYSVDDIVVEAIHDQQKNDKLHRLFESFDEDGEHFLSENEFINGILTLNSSLSESEVKIIYH